MSKPKILNGVLIITLVMSLPLPAAEWSAEPAVSLRTGYNDNLRLTADAHDPVWEANFSPSVRFGVATENKGLTGDAGIRIRRFAGGSGRESSSALNREDYFLNTAAYHHGLRNSLRASLDYSRESTLDSELDVTGNVIDQNATREKLTLAPSWSRALTEQMRLDLSYHFSNVDYSDDPGIADLVGYSYQVASASLVRLFSPRIQGTLSGSYSGYQPDTNFDSTTLSLQAGLSAVLSETVQASLLAGQRRTTSDSSIGAGFCIGAMSGASFPSCTGGIAIPTGSAKTEVETMSAVYSANITKVLETGTLGAALTRSSSPGGEGELLDSTRLVLTGRYNLSETLSTSLRIEISEYETIVNRVGFVSNQGKNTLLSVIPKASWRWRREWALGWEYQYASSDPANGNEASRNAFLITLDYHPGKFSVSR